MGEITTIGLDLAKHVFQVHAIDAAGQVVVRQLRRGEVLKFFEKLPACLVGIEACGVGARDFGTGAYGENDAARLREALRQTR